MRRLIIFALLLGCGDALEEGRGPFVYTIAGRTQVNSEGCALGGPRHQEVFEALGRSFIGFAYEDQDLELLYCPPNMPPSACVPQTGQVQELNLMPFERGPLHNSAWGGDAAPSSELLLFGWSTLHEAALRPEETIAPGCGRLHLLTSVWVDAISEDLVRGGYTIAYDYPQGLRQECRELEVQAQMGWSGCKTELQFRGERTIR